MYPPPTPIPLVFFDSVLTVFTGLPFQSTRHALSVFCSPIHRPSRVAVMAFGYPSGLLNSVVVFACRAGGGGAAWLADCRAATRVPRKPTPRVPRNALRAIAITCLPFNGVRRCQTPQRHAQVSDTFRHLASCGHASSTPWLRLRK